MFSTILYSQEKGSIDSTSTDFRVRHFRIGLKIGTPNAVGGTFEIVLPILNNHLAPFIDYSKIKVTIDDGLYDLNYFEAGANIYFNNKGRGLYGVISYGMLNLEGTFTDVELTSGGIDLEVGSAYSELKIETANVKLGLKLGKKFYFLTELGYGFGYIPDEIILTGTINGKPATAVRAIPGIPGVGNNGYPIFNLGCGLSF